MTATTALALATILLATSFSPSHPASAREEDDFTVEFYLSCNNTTLSSVEANVTFFNETSSQDFTNFTLLDSYPFDYQNNFSGNLTDVQAVVAVSAPPSSCPEGSWTLGGANLTGLSDASVYLNFTSSPPPPPANLSGGTNMTGLGSSTSLIHDLLVLVGIGLFSLLVGWLLISGFRRMLLPPGRS